MPSGKVANVIVEKPKWKPPTEGHFKINTDAAINGSLGRVRIGIIIRDSAGHVMASSSQSLRSILSPQSAKVVAILRGLQLARDSGLWPCSIESDALSVVNLINLKVVPCAEIGLVIQDILSLVDKLYICEVSFVQRDANMATHWLAKFGLSSVSDLVWLENVPSCMSPFVLGNCPDPFVTFCFY
ncbi:hypothetical protein Ddye_012316 [Dipteronia dyeriana]|uniref:RNase H type-1 domain-containing protein n=1 Tax=Dipteronia dyeriana TaxID=168575 RepID=A0AAD9X4A1_9ROSI|nr:hypothetical protein Ddye_012316 [Dipteronia dyeriana]